MRADTLFLERAAIEINDRVCLISADEELDAELHITEAGVRHVLGLLRQRFNYIVVDVPVPFPPSIHPVITLSRHVLVLLEAEVTGLRNAHALRAAVTNIAGKDRVFTLLNRADRAGGLPRQPSSRPWVRNQTWSFRSRQRDDPGGQSRNSGSEACPRIATPPRADCSGDYRGRGREEVAQEAARAMKKFGKREGDGTPTRLPALTPKRRTSSAQLPSLAAPNRVAHRATRDVSFAARTSHRAD